MQIPVHKIEENKLFIKWRDITITADSIEQAHRHNYFQFMLLSKVKGAHEIDFETYPAENSSLHFVGKGRVHKVDFNSEVLGGVFVFPELIFGSSEQDLKLMSSLTYFKNGAQPILNLSTSEFVQVSALTNSLKESLASQSLEMSKHLLFALLILTRDLYNKTNNNSPRKETQELIFFNQLLKAQGKKWSKVEEFTAEIGVSSLRLNSLCKEQYSKSALQLIHDRKLLEAKRMLVYTEKQVKEIAYDCGFVDVAYFNRFFKKHTGCTPLTFRKNY
jgi:AraC-like DNA-binding protein